MEVSLEADSNHTLGRFGSAMRYIVPILTWLIKAVKDKKKKKKKGLEGYLYVQRICVVA